MRMSNRYWRTGWLALLLVCLSLLGIGQRAEAQGFDTVLCGPTFDNSGIGSATQSIVGATLLLRSTGGQGSCFSTSRLWEPTSTVNPNQFYLLFNPNRDPGDTLVLDFRMVWGTEFSNVELNGVPADNNLDYFLDATTEIAVQFETAEGRYSFTTTYDPDRNRLAGFVVLGEPVVGPPQLAVRNAFDTFYIPNGSIGGISTASGTDYGPVLLGASVTRTFGVESLGETDLTFGADALSIDNTTDFTIVTDLPDGGTLPVGNTQPFSIRFNPDTIGDKRATVTIRSNDTAQDPYIFLIGGEGIVPPTPPTVTVDIADDRLSDGDNSSPVAFDFSKPVVGFSESDLTVVGGTISGFTGSGSRYSATFTAADDFSGTGSVTVQNASYTDLDGNLGVDGSDTTEIDTVNPNVTISGLPTAATGPFTATFTFSETVTGFAAADISVGNGSVTIFSGTDRVYTATIAPSANGEVTVDIPAGAAQDAFDNGNAAARASTVFNGMAPTLVISGVPGRTDGPFTATFTFSETVTGFSVSDILVGNGTITGFFGSGATYSATISPVTDGVVTIDVAANVAQDADGNGNEAAAASTVFDGLAPSVRVTRAPATTSVTTPFVVVIEFSEPVTGFEAGEIYVGNGIVSSFSGSGQTYTVTITPQGDGDITIDVPANVAQDAAGNGNTAARRVTVKVSATIEETVQTMGAFMGARSNLILQNRPNIGRRLDRLKGTVTNNGGFSGFGLNFSGGAIPFMAQIDQRSASFSYSLRRSQAEASRASVRIDPLTALRHMGVSLSLGAEPARNHFVEADRPDQPRQPATQPAAFGAEGVRQGPYAMAFTDAEATADDAYTGARFDLWAEGRLAKFDAYGGSGEFAILHAGVDYLVTPDLLVGFGGQLDWINFEGTATREADGRGYMLGPYATARLNDRLFLDAQVSWGRSFNDISPFGTYRDSFEAERFLATGALIGDFEIGAFNIQPELRANWFTETSNSYVDALGNKIPSIEVESGTLEFGSMISGNFDIGNSMTATPSLGAKGIWTFASRNTANDLLPDPQHISNEGLRARLEMGLDIARDDGLSFGLSGAYDGIGDKSYKEWSLAAQLGFQW